jgi:hypothetical protein
VGEVVFRGDWGEVDEVYNSVGATLLLYVSLLAMCSSASSFWGASAKTRRFAFVRVGEVFNVVIGGIILKVVIGFEGMFSGVDEFFNRFVKIIIVLHDVLCLLSLDA